ncbi:unnamed protein product [Hymenolepis diminuta]|uniref:AP-1 complex subunit beta-1 n=1 Tax=Hymenolepis diminuta TaxID=6216 RepID=A0A3P6W4N1_HYMDI|nr:unnamed protein product [Hymenolepis diminuta]
MATLESDNPDLRDRGYIYWRLLSTDPTAAKEVVLAEKPLISEETDLLEPSLLDELVCNLGSLASVYHQPPSAFVEGKHISRRQLFGGSSGGGLGKIGGGDAGQQPTTTVIPTQETLIGDLLDIDTVIPTGNTIVQPVGGYAGAAPIPGIDMEAPDLLGDGLDDLLPGVTPKTPTVGQSDPSTADALADIFGGMGVSSGATSGPSNSLASHGLTSLVIASPPPTYIPAPSVWLESSRGKGLEISGTFSLDTTADTPQMELTFTNNALSPMTDFAIQFNKNSFGLAPAEVLSVPSPLQPKQSAKMTLPLGFANQVVKMDPLMNLQVAVKNNFGVFYFACLVPIHVLFTSAGEMEKMVFLATWKDIPAENEQQFVLSPLSLDADTCSQKLRNNNVFTIAKRNVDGQDMLYQSIKLCNGIWVLAELKIQPGNMSYTVSKCFSILYPYA